MTGDSQAGNPEFVGTKLGVSYRETMGLSVGNSQSCGACR